MPILLVIVSGLHEIDEILSGSKARIDIEVIVDVIAMVGAIIVSKHRRQPDCSAAQSRNIVEILSNAFDPAAIEFIVRRRHTLTTIGCEHGLARGIVVESIHHQEVDKLLAPLAFDVEVCLSGMGLSSISLSGFGCGMAIYSRNSSTIAGRIKLPLDSGEQLSIHKMEVVTVEIRFCPVVCR
jgi:hypothetical protein